MATPEMMYCRYCGQQIHASAPACPQCGGLQHPSRPAARGAEPGLWMPIVALVCAIVSVLALMNEEVPERDAINGIFLLGTIGAVFGIVSIMNQAIGKKMAITSVVMSSVALLAAFGLLLE